MPRGSACVGLDMEIEAGRYEIVVRHFRDGAEIPAYELDFGAGPWAGRGPQWRLSRSGDDVFTLNLEFATAAQFITSDGQADAQGHQAGAPAT